MTSSRLVLTVILTILALQQSAAQRPPPPGGGPRGGTRAPGGGGTSNVCKCAVDGSDYKYTEAVEGFTRTVVTSWCPNHYYDDANLNPNSAVTTGESTITMPAMPMPSCCPHLPAVSASRCICLPPYPPPPPYPRSKKPSAVLPTARGVARCSPPTNRTRTPNWTMRAGCRY